MGGAICRSFETEADGLTVNDQDECLVGAFGLKPWLSASEKN